AGALCAAVSGYVGSLLSPGGAWLGPFSFVIGTITAFTAGCVAWGGRLPLRVSLRGNFVVNGAIIVYLVGTVLWFGHGTGRGLPLLPLVYYGLGFAAVLAGSVFAGRMLAGEKRALKVPALMLCAFAGLVGGASVANFFTLVLYDLPTPVWKVLTFQAPLERLFFSLGTALVGAPLLASLPKLGIFLGPRFEEDPPEGTFPEDDESDDENEKPKTDDTEATDED
ncbi:MAG: hypothetical protein FWD94_03015, partial [Treponema sp.]|nr:hypothetical protein [Treponema sp.]